MADSQSAPIFLVGYRGTGKSLVARELARILDFNCIDADDVVEARAGKSIARIFADSGEQVFRELEALVVAELSRAERTVVALGGGAVLREDNRRAVRAAGTVVWLSASVDTIMERLASDEATASRRPNLTKTGGKGEVEELLALRTPLYRECANFAVDTDGKSGAQIAGEIAAVLGR